MDMLEMGLEANWKLSDIEYWKGIERDNGAAKSEWTEKRATEEVQRLCETDNTDT